MIRREKEREVGFRTYLDRLREMGDALVILFGSRARGTTPPSATTTCR
ncbi:MAG: hypothetical protein QXH90_07790 [Candidatus Korarchaeum sp.]